MDVLQATNNTGVTISLNENETGFGIEAITHAEKPFEPALSGPLFNLRVFDHEESVVPVRLPLIECAEAQQAITWIFRGTKKIIAAEIAVTVTLQLLKDVPAITMDILATTDRTVNARIEAAFCRSNAPNYLRANVYPWAEDSLHLPEEIDHAYSSIYSDAKQFPVSAWHGKLFNWCGIPAVFFRNEERSMSFLMGVHKDFDYGKPGTWMEDVSIEMAPDEPVRLVSGTRKSVMQAGTSYHLPVQIMFSANHDYLTQPKELVEAWVAVNRYTAQALPHPQLKTPAAMKEFMINARRNAQYYVKGATYLCDQHRQGMFDTYIINTPINVYLDLLLAKLTGDAVWRERAIEQLAWLVRMRVNNPDDVNFGAYYPIAPGAKTPSFYQYKGACEEFEVEQNARAGYWLLKILESVERHELEAVPGLDELRASALQTLSWVKKQQQPDGSMPQKVSVTGAVNGPVTPAHSLLAFRAAHNLTGEAVWQQAMIRSEQWALEHSIMPAKFFGAHSDLHPAEYEEGSIHVLTSYALARYQDTGNQYYVRMAEYLASISFFWRCPKQLSWVAQPTQGCNVEQSHYLQYSLYSYYSFKYLNFIRLTALTGNPLFDREGRYLLQQSAHCIVPEGEWKGAHYERLADPWYARKDDSTTAGNIYASELAPELLLQLLLLEKPEAARW